MVEPGWAEEAAAEETGEGSKTFRLLTIQRIGSTGSQRASARENTSVQKTGGVVIGSGVAAETFHELDIRGYLTGCPDIPRRLELDPDGRSAVAPKTCPLLLVLRSLMMGLAFSLPFALSLFGVDDSPSSR